MREWLSLYDSKSGERGIYNSMSAKRTTDKLNQEKDQDGNNIIRRHAREDFGTNPCSEIILRSREFCNLTECVIRGRDTLQSLNHFPISSKVRLLTQLFPFNSCRDVFTMLILG